MRFIMCLLALCVPSSVVMIARYTQYPRRHVCARYDVCESPLGAASSHPTSVQSIDPGRPTSNVVACITFAVHHHSCQAFVLLCM
jgi:hypothetical protein